MTDVPRQRHGGAADPQTVATVASGLAVVALTAVIVGIATGNGGVAGVAFTLAGGCVVAAALMILAMRLLRPTPPPPTRLPADPARTLRVMAADDLRLVADQTRDRALTLAARAAGLGRWATGLLTAGGTLLALTMPVFWLAGDGAQLPAGAAGTVTLLLVAITPVAGLALCRAVMSGEWAPATALPADPGSGWNAESWRGEALRRTAARWTVACAVNELVVERRRRVVALMVAILGAEAVWMVVVVLARIGRL